MLTLLHLKLTKESMSVGTGVGHGQRRAEQQGREMGFSDRCGFSRWIGSRWAVSSREGGALGKGSEERVREEVCNCPSIQDRCFRSGLWGRNSGKGQSAAALRIPSPCLILYLPLSSQLGEASLTPSVLFYPGYSIVLLHDLFML